MNNDLFPNENDAADKEGTLNSGADPSPEFIEPQENFSDSYGNESLSETTVISESPKPDSGNVTAASAESPRSKKPLSKSEKLKKRRKILKTAKKVFRATKKTIATFGSILLSLFLIIVITGTIVATVLTVYILKMMGDTYDVDLYDLETSSSTYILGTDPETGDYEELYYVENDSMCIPVDIEVVPQHAMNAFVFAEDERFFLHDGVDYKSTLGAFANMIFNIYDTDRGGSTITQQLVKNLTGDNATSGTAGPMRKIREIFRSMSLEQRYAKLEILEAYMNNVGFGGGAIGIEYAAEKYFGKTISEVSIAEAASLAAIPKSPENNNPFAGHYKKLYNQDTGELTITDEYLNTGVKENRGRQEYILKKMYENGAITRKEYQDALDEKLIFVDSEAYRALHPELYIDEDKTAGENDVTSYVVDAVLIELAGIFQKEMGITYSDALKKINSGGYTIYTTADLAMQEALEAKYIDYNNVYDKGYAQKAYDADGKPILDENGENEYIYPNSSFIVMDYSGNIKAVIGGIGEKQSSLGLLRPFQSERQPGSCIKPVSTYGCALENDFITWSTIFIDEPLTVNGQKWPHNFGSWSMSNKFVYRALEVSLNTVPAQICKELGPQTIFDFMVNKMHFTTLVTSDIDLSPLSVGGLTHGMTLRELCNAYTVYGNGGSYYESTIIAKVVDANGNIVIDHENKFGEQAVSSDTSYIMNRLLRRVVANSSDGTGRQANLDGVEVCGKTGTSQNFRDLGFVGLTPDYVAAIWLGFDNSNSGIYNSSGSNSFSFIYGNYPKSAKMWAKVFGDYAIAANAESHAVFPVDDTVQMLYFCNSTGLIAGPDCSKCSVPGYYKSTNIPPTCTACAAAKAAEDATSTSTGE